MEALGINLPGLIAQIVNFSILLFLLSKFAYAPIMRMLDERAGRIRESMETAEAIRQQAARAEQEVQAQLDAARRDGQNLIAQAERLGEQLREEAREAARQEAQTIVDRAHAQLQVEREAALAELRREFVNIAIMAAERVIKENLDREKHQKLIRDVLEESPALRGPRG